MLSVILGDGFGTLLFSLFVVAQYRDLFINRFGNFGTATWSAFRVRSLILSGYQLEVWGNSVDPALAPHASNAQLWS